MKIGDRIRECRIELGYSQDELAKRLGYKSRSSINKIERDASGLPQTKIAAIAEALQTTPGYIMGWEEKPSKKVGMIVHQEAFQHENRSGKRVKPTIPKKSKLHKVFTISSAANAVRFVRQQLGFATLAKTEIADDGTREVVFVSKSQKSNAESVEKTMAPISSQPDLQTNGGQTLGEIEKELLRICEGLDIKRKHALLSKAYELAEDKS